MNEHAKTAAAATATGTTIQIVRLTAILTAGFAVLICVSLFFIVKNYRPTLNWDQWGDLKFLLDIKDGTFSVSELFSQNNEHRIFTARLLFLIDAFWFGYRNSFLLAATFVSHLILGGIIGLLWFDHNYDVRVRAAACTGGGATLVSIAQFENLIWGFQAQFALVYLFAVIALYLLGRACIEVRTDRRLVFLLLYVVFYSLSAFSMANGLVVLGPALMLIVLLRGRWFEVAVVAIAALVIGSLYLHGYQKPPQHEISERLSLAPGVLLYACHFLAAPLLNGSSPRILLGGIGIALLLLSYVILFWDARRGRHGPLSLVVLTSIAGFVFASAVLTGIGRVTAFGVEQAASGRYATPALVFWLAIAGVAHWLVVERFGLGRSQQFRNLSGIALLILLLSQVIRLDLNADTQRTMSEWAWRIDRASMAIINNVYFTEGSGLDVLFVPSVIKERVGPLRKYGWSIFSPAQKIYVPPLHLVAGLSDLTTPRCRGFVDSVMRLDDQRLALRGWLLAPTVAQSPSWIFVRDELGGIIGYFIPHDWRHDLVTAFGPNAGNGYFAAVDFKHAIPTGNRKISFVAVFENAAVRTCTITTDVLIPAYAIASDYGELGGRAIDGLQSESSGRVVPQTAPPPVVALPLTSATLFTVGKPSPGPAIVTYRFDASNLRSEDLAIPVTANTGYDFPVEVSGPDGPIQTLTLNTLNYNVWNIWRLAIVPRALLPVGGEIEVRVQFPDGIPEGGATVRPPFAIPPNPNRAALY